MNDAVKFCKDCKWIEPGVKPTNAKCLNPSAEDSQAASVTDYYVTGEGSPPTHLYCSTMRMPQCACAPAGKLWEPQP